MLPSRLFYDDMLDRFDDRKMSCDVYEKEGKFYLDMDIPGFKKEDIKIEFDENLTIIDSPGFVVKNSIYNQNSLKLLEELQIFQFLPFQIIFQCLRYLFLSCAL